MIRGICALRTRLDSQHVYRRRRLFVFTNRAFFMFTWIFKHWNISKSWGGHVSFLGAVKKKGWSNPIRSIVMWILLSRLGCWMNKCGSLFPDFCVLYFLGYVLLSMRRSFSLLHADQVENRLHFQILWITYFVQILVARRVITDALSCVFVRLSTSAEKEGAMFMIWKLDAVFWTHWRSWIRILKGLCWIWRWMWFFTDVCSVMVCNTLPGPQSKACLRTFPRRDEYFLQRSVPAVFSKSPIEDVL